ncbi:unnamed protein product [Malus baccata var. baccata]
MEKLTLILLLCVHQFVISNLKIYIFFLVVRKKALKLLLLQPISTIYQALIEAPGKHIHYIANLEKPWYTVVLKVFLIMLLCPVGRVYMTCSELRDTDRLIHP